MRNKDDIVVVRGGGDIASGAIQKLYRSGFKVLVLETETPSAIRRKVAFCEAVYEKEIEIEGIKARLVANDEEIQDCWDSDILPVMIDSRGKVIERLKPLAVVDGILAKQNFGTKRSMAPITIALGPGFSAPEDVDIVIETMRGHNLGRIIEEGRASENTGVPGIIAGFGIERVIYSDYSGVITNIEKIGNVVEKGDVIAVVGDNEIYASISGVLRGIIRDGYKVKKGLKIADIDPRISEKDNCFTISDKARNIGGAVLESILYLKKKKGIVTTSTSII
ncbi:selenium-dependent molybdenum cofactor biosynthesis protein YqeB [uncultured Fusobacterium sp.]|uniref:selenium-dependent molybdenum cofactor biosynthesis protein YqeB n=1 Tax=uncultured Fusobacterium sp. TaxID=159267 RepID=UPI0025E0FA0E|nr:selenium-dependent molybdenum cofactor biosynthesis protein YqeB [uncultured Fusobacterium sp.]